MKIAVPMNGNEMAMHFGHCEAFRVFKVEANAVVGTENLTPPPHEPGVLPRFLAGEGVTHILAGGMGQRAQQLFQAAGVEVVVGVSGVPSELVERFLAGTLKAGENICDH
jgi:predicted Fe-Mo cluster-binding NifX family protein